MRFLLPDKRFLPDYAYRQVDGRSIKIAGMNEVSFSSALFVIRGKDRGRRFELSARDSLIGRHGSNDVQLFDGKASRQHAKIVFEGSRFKIVDLKSSNGTFVNDKQIDSDYLTSGDKILIGNTVLLFTEGISINSDSSRVIKLNSDSIQGVGGIKISDPDENSSQNYVLHSVDLDSPLDFSQLITSDSTLGLEHVHEQLRILYSASLRNSVGVDVDEILERMLDVIFQMVDARYGCIMLISEEPELEIRAQAKKFRNPSDATDDYEIPRVILDRALQDDQGILASRRIKTNEETHQRQVICAPMHGRYGRVGLIYIEGMLDANDETSPDNAPSAKCFTEEQLKLILAIGHQSGLTIEEKIFSAALVHNERMSAIGETVAMLAHQVKNIMQGMGGGGYMIKKGLENNEPDSIRKGWNIVEKNQERISDLILDLLSYSKERKPNLQPHNLTETINEAIDIIGSYATENGVELHKQVPDNIPARYDETMIQRAITNVVLNAIDACADKGAGALVDVVYVPDPDQCVIEIRDNGIGIEAKNLTKIFSPFKSTKGGRGTGLGLTIARKNYREHGGNVQVESEFGSGTTFRLSMPYLDLVESDDQPERYEQENTLRQFSTKTQIPDDREENRAK